MNPYKEDGPRARLSFDRAYCKRCTGASSVNDGYIRGPGHRSDRRAMLSPRLKLSFGSAATGPL